MTEASTQAALISKTKAAQIIGALTIIGIALSIANELFNLPWETPGWALLTRSIHAWLGLGALMGVIFHYRAGYVMLVLWIVSSFPIIATDTSGNWTDTVLKIETSTQSSSQTMADDTQAFYTDLDRKGINFSPILVIIWFLVGLKLKAFPVGLKDFAPVKTTRLACTTLLACGLLGIIGYASYLMTAPALIWGGSRGIQFYYKDQLLGTQWLRVDAQLLDKIGLDSQQAEATWSTVSKHITPFGLGVYLTDGIGSARIDVRNPHHHFHEIDIDTPWGARTAVLVTKNESFTRSTIHMVRPLVNLDFKIQVLPERASVSINQPLTLEVSIGAHKNNPQFTTANVHVLFTELGPNQMDQGHYLNNHHSIDTPAGIEAMTAGFAQFPIQVKAPSRPGVYSVSVRQIWLYDADGEYADPTRVTGRSSRALITVETPSVSACRDTFP
jgi:hypothetical protein